jgi:hypothetical protein
MTINCEVPKELLKTKNLPKPGLEYGNIPLILFRRVNGCILLSAAICLTFHKMFSKYNHIIFIDKTF